MSYDFQYYSGRHLTYPARPKRPPTPTITTADELHKLADQYEVYEKELQVFNEKVKEYSVETGKLLTEFQEKLKEDYGLCDSEFAVLWDEAYEKGHSGGIQEVYHAFDNLYYFVKKYVQTMKGL